MPATPHNRMAPMYWIPREANNLLDIGCNVGELLTQCKAYRPGLQLAGLDLNSEAIETAKANLPDADLRQGHGSRLPFDDNRFQCVTCINVIEHVPPEKRANFLAEIRRVLAPGGRLVLSCPHDGIFSWLDAENFRFRFPRLYRLLLGGGGRDANYAAANEDVCWHHHFTREELTGLAGGGWVVESCRLGGLLLFPLSDLLRWPFYRLKKSNHAVVRWLERIGGMEVNWDFGRSSYYIMLALKKC